MYWRRNLVAGENAFFRWKKMLVRSFHLFIVLFISASLFIKDTGKTGGSVRCEHPNRSLASFRFVCVELRRSLVLRNHTYYLTYSSIVYASLLFYFATCLTSPGYVKRPARNRSLPTTSRNTLNDQYSVSLTTMSEQVAHCIST